MKPGFSGTNMGLPCLRFSDLLEIKQIFLANPEAVYMIRLAFTILPLNEELSIITYLPNKLLNYIHMSILLTVP